MINILEYKECRDQAIRVRDATKAGEVDEATWKKLDMKARNMSRHKTQHDWDG